MVSYCSGVDVVGVRWRVRAADGLRVLDGDEANQGLLPEEETRHYPAGKPQQQILRLSF